MLAKRLKVLEEYEAEIISVELKLMSSAA